MKSDHLLPKVRWSSYQSYEGPIFPGSVPYDPDTSTFSGKVLAVVCATEGPRRNAVNMYDSCIVSVGPLQSCERFFFVTSMLGMCADEHHQLLMSYLSEIPMVGVNFKKNSSGKWRFFLGNAEVKTIQQMQQLYLGGCNGNKGNWTSSQKQYAVRVAAMFGALFEDSTFWNTQDKYLAPATMSYSNNAADILFGQGYPTDGWDGAMRAAYISYSVNLPAVARQQLLNVINTPEWKSPDPAIRGTKLLRALTFGPKVAIYPSRYNAIRPVLEKLFGVNVPDFASELARWHETFPGVDLFPDLASIQRELIAQGYDLGPSKDDNVWGTKSIVATKKWQGIHNLKPDGVWSPLCIAVLVDQKLKREGKALRYNGKYPNDVS